MEKLSTIKCIYNFTSDNQGTFSNEAIDENDHFSLSINIKFK